MQLPAYNCCFTADSCSWFTVVCIIIFAIVVWHCTHTVCASYPFSSLCTSIYIYTQYDYNTCIYYTVCCFICASCYVGYSPFIGNAGCCTPAWAQSHKILHLGVHKLCLFYTLLYYSNAFSYWGLLASFQPEGNHFEITWDIAYFVAFHKKKHNLGPNNVVKIGMGATCITTCGS